MTTETITLNEFIYDMVGYRIQRHVIDEEIFDEDAGELDDYYIGQYESDVILLIEIMKQRIEEDKFYDFKIDYDCQIDYECQGRYDIFNFVGTPYPEFDTKLHDILEDYLTDELDELFEDQPPV